MMDDSTISMTPIKVTLTAADSCDGTEILLSTHLVPMATRPDRPFLALPPTDRTSWAGKSKHIAYPSAYYNSILIQTETNNLIKHTVTLTHARASRIHTDCHLINDPPIV